MDSTRLYNETSGNNRRDTRWWLKDAALRKVFGGFTDPGEALYIDVLLSLHCIPGQDSAQPLVKTRAKGFYENLTEFETVLTAKIYLKLFEHTTPLSKYLQTVQLDLITVHCMVTELRENVQTMRNEFEVCHTAAVDFVKWADEKL